LVLFIVPVALSHFSTNKIKILEQSDYISDDAYLRKINGMVQSIKEARTGPVKFGVNEEALDW